MTLLEFFFIISGVIILIIGLDIAKKQRFNALHFLVFLGVGGGLVVFTFFPNILQKVGDIFGVARGADVLVYGAIVFLLYFVLLLLTKYIENKENITKLVRELAIENSSKRIIKGKEVFVIPAYNEEKVLSRTIQNILDKGYNNIILVNDGSKDNTKTILEKFGNKIITVHHYTNRGQGSALETGFEYVRRFGDVEYVVTYDADGQHSINDLKTFEDILQKDEKIDILLGSRFLGEKQSNVPFFRKVLLKLSLLFTFFVSHIYLSDSHNGYRVIRKKVLEKIKITQDGMTHASEILDIIAREKMVYKEVPVTIKYTDYSLAKGQSSGNAIGIALRMIWTKFFK